MKFTTTLCLAALTALASARAAPQEEATTTVALTTTATATTATNTVTETEVASTVPLTPQQQCVAACDPSNVGCLAACVDVPNPDEDQADRTTQCVAACPQGSGTQADTDAYTLCRDQCINSIYLSTRTADATGVVGTATSLSTVTATTATGTTLTTTGLVATGSALSSAVSSAVSSALSSVTGSARVSGNSTSTSTATSTTTTSATGAAGTNAAGHLEMGAPVVGLAGLVAALLAL